MHDDTAIATCRTVLYTANPHSKVAVIRNFLEGLKDTTKIPLGDTNAPLSLPDDPARPDDVMVCHPRDLPKRKISPDPQARFTQLHALAHIELNAIDLACDMVARFAHHIDNSSLYSFVTDWLTIADEESLHFTMLDQRLAELGGAYGDLAVHGRMWDMARVTKDSLLGRLAVVPMVLEARGLDVTPGMIAKFTQAGDHTSAKILQRILADEVGHVACGRKWFEFACQDLPEAPEKIWHVMVRKYMPSGVRGPFNHEQRMLAGLLPSYYEGFTPPPFDDG
ncbi:MAG: ferritin-like domain-containing protein [Pseudomonadota bacterium]